MFIYNFTEAKQFLNETCAHSPQQSSGTNPQCTHLRPFRPTLGPYRAHLFSTFQLESTISGYVNVCNVDEDEAKNNKIYTAPLPIKHLSVLPLLWFRIQQHCLLDRHDTVWLVVLSSALLLLRSERNIFMQWVCSAVLQCTEMCLFCDERKQLAIPYLILTKCWKTIKHFTIQLMHNM